MTKRAIIVIMLTLAAFFTRAQTNTNNYQLLWEISGKGIKQPSYLFGTIHLNDSRVFNLPDSAIIAFNSVDAFAMEVHPDSMMNYLLNNMDVFTEANFKFSDHMDYEQYRDLQTEVREVTGIDDLRLDDHNIDMLRNVIQGNLAKGEETTILDVHFFRMSQMQKKSGYSLEPIEVQLEVLNDKSFLKDLEDIRMYLGLGQDYEAMMDTMMQLYLAGDIDAIDRYMNDYDDTAYIQALLYDRNELMAENIQQIMKRESGFFAIGAGHLGGTKGVVQLLRNAGYKMRPVKATYTGLADEFTYEADTTTGWAFHLIEEYGYGMDFPGKPAFVDNLKGQDLAGYLYIDMRDMTTYFTMQMEIPVTIDSTNYPIFRDAMLVGISQQLGTEGDLEMTEVIRDGVPGVHVLMPVGDITAYADLLFHGNHIIMSMVGREKGTVPAELVNRFLSSFEKE